MFITQVLCTGKCGNHRDHRLQAANGSRHSPGKNLHLKTVYAPQLNKHKAENKKNSELSELRAKNPPEVNKKVGLQMNASAKGTRDMGGGPTTVLTAADEQMACILTHTALHGDQQ